MLNAAPVLRSWDYSCKSVAAKHILTSSRLMLSSVYIVLDPLLSLNGHSCKHKLLLHFWYFHKHNQKEVAVLTKICTRAQRSLEQLRWQESLSMHSAALNCMSNSSPCCQQLGALLAGLGMQLSSLAAAIFCWHC